MIAAGNDLYFGRLATGEVRILQLAAGSAAPANVDSYRDPSPAILLDVQLEADKWAELVAGVSRLGAIDNRVFRAQAFHAGR